MITAFVNGCFDLLHIGHIRMLSYAKRQAWIMSEAEDENGLLNSARLIVAINSDESIRKLKGPNRPIIPQEQRKEMLESIRWVDEVTIFDDELSLNCLIEKLQPSFIVRGPDHKQRSYNGIYVNIYPCDKSISSSDIIERIKQDDYDLR